MTSVYFEITVIVFLNLTISSCWEYRWKNPCDKEPGILLPFCNNSLSFLSRAEDLVSRLTLEESISQLGFTAMSIPRLNISEYNWWMDGAHGLGQGVNWSRFPLHSATMFPQIISTSSSFNRTLWKQIGDAISTEARAYFNYDASGLTFWDPNINIFRDCRWGRGQETPGEDPFVSAEYGINFVQGMQGDEKKNGYLKLSVTCKHFAAYSFDNYDGITRHKFNAIVSDYDLNDTYLVPIKYCVLPTHGSGSGVMCSYNAVNGIPSCANYLLLTHYLKNEWNFNGYITSDCGATDDILYEHKYTSNRGETCGVVYSAGMTQDCSNFMETNAYNAIMNNYITNDNIKYALIQNFRVLMRLGMFDKPQLNPWHNLGINDVNTLYHQQISLDAAKQSIILFKNNNKLLPLSINKIQKIAVLGPNANNSLVVQGNYAGTPPFIINMLDGIKSYINNSGNDINILYNKGCDINSTSTFGFKQSIQYAQQADITILIMGIDQTIEDEGHDRHSILLPGIQNEFITNISNIAYNANHNVILVILSGGCLDIEQFDNNNIIHSIIWSGYSGMFAGTALSHVIFGDFNPTGLTTQTWYKQNYVNQVSFFDMGITPNGTNPGRGYRYYYNKTNILYEFGYGLSYTNFICDNLQIFNSNMSLSIDIVNKGTMYSGGAVILIYWIPNNGGNNNIPIKRLVAFDRINLLNIGQKYTNFNMLIYQQFFWSNEYQSGNGKFMLGGACTE